MLAALLFLFSFGRGKGEKIVRYRPPLGGRVEESEAKWGIGPAPRAPITSSIFHRHRYRYGIKEHFLFSSG